MIKFLDCWKFTFIGEYVQERGFKSGSEPDKGQCRDIAQVFAKKFVLKTY